MIGLPTADFLLPSGRITDTSRLEACNSVSESRLEKDRQWEGESGVAKIVRSERPPDSEIASVTGRFGDQFN
jgi:hypothetical protein